MSEKLHAIKGVIQNISNKVSKKCTDGDIDTFVRKLMPLMAEMCHLPIGNHKNGALALAHCQIDQEAPLRFFVLKGGTAVVNPHIVSGQRRKIHNEGCMSFAEKMCLRGVYRYTRITANFIEINPSGQRTDHKEQLVKNEFAFIMQHEIDHMNGKHIF